MAGSVNPLTKTELRRLKALGDRIRTLRLGKKLTLEQVEERGFPSWKHLQATEYGRKNLTITSLFRLAEALGVDPKDIINGI
jgi:transcriptional regulator with XRE-family HTH domain